jgi:uncharacterized membrane protein YeaQ/YmgE (transglycosylase-associated protein family)
VVFWHKSNRLRAGCGYRGCSGGVCCWLATAFGIIGATIAALIGIWLMTQVIIISGIPDYKLNTSPPIYLVRALIGAVLFVFLWHLLTYPLYRSRRRYYRYR